jgi:hypothetical protein
MAFTTSNLDSKLKQYLDSNKMKLFVDSVVANDETSFMSLMPGTRTDAPIVILALDAALQSGAACGFNPADTDISNRTVHVIPVKADYEWCENDLLGTAFASEFSKDDMAFEEKLTKMIVDKNTKALNELVWAGDTNSGDLMDGLLTIIANDAAITPISNNRQNYMDRVKDVYMAIKPEHSDSVLFVSPVVYKTLVMELTDAKVLNYDYFINGKTNEFTYPGTNLRVRCIESMGTSTYMFATTEENLVYATDFESDSLRVWFSPDNQTWRAEWLVLAGVNYAFSDRIVYDIA